MPSASIPATPTSSDIACQNGALSRGPTTPAGKARSARNATRHGICARSMTPLDPEDAAALASLRAAMHARHRPVDEAEAHWVEELVFVAWRQRRLRVLEDAVLTRAEGEAEPDLPSLATLIRYRGRLDRDWRRAGEELAALRQPRPTLVAPAQSVRRDDAHATLNGTSEPKLSAPPPPPPPPPTRTQVASAAHTDEPRHPVPPLPDLAADEPLPPLRPLNRHERRRLAALQRQAA